MRINESIKFRRCTQLFAIGVLLTLPIGCGKRSGTGRQNTKAEQLWFLAEYTYRTNELRTAYQRITNVRDELTKMSKTNPDQLKYDYCLAILNGRLFLMARELGDPAAAAQNLERSAFHFNRERENVRKPPTNYSPERIEALIKEWDTKAH